MLLLAPLALALPAKAIPNAPDALSAAPVLAADSSEMRVLRIGRRLAQAARPECPGQHLPAPLLLHDLTSYPARERPAVAAETGLGEGFGVRGAVDGPLRADDEIIGASGAFALPVTRGASRHGSHDRVSAFEHRLAAALTKGAVPLQVRRGDTAQVVVIQAEAGCAARTVLVAGKVADAWSDSQTIAVTSALAAMADDDEMAFVVGHEMAHIIARDGTGAQWLSSFGIGANRARNREITADRLGALLARRAGFDPHAATRLLVRLARVRDLDHAASHPGSAARIAAIEHALASGR